MEGAIRFFNEALRSGVLQKENVYTVKPDVHPQAYTLYLTKSEVRDGIANNYIQVSRNSTIDEFKRRKAIIQKMAAKFTMGELKILCIGLKIDFDEIKGESKTEKAANLLEYVERKGKLTVVELETLIEDGL